VAHRLLDDRVARARPGLVAVLRDTGSDGRRAAS
jgi:hypothetical protein